MADTKVVMLCGHCGNKTIHEVRGEYAHTSNRINIRLKQYQVTTIWRLLECSTCSKPTLQQKGDTDFFEDEGEILYPSKTPITNLPDTIEKRYKAALKVQNIEPSACAVLVGRTLEAVCNYESAAGRTLSDKLNSLVGSDRIPKTLAEMAHQLRQIRNLGAHDADDEVTEADVSIILDFLEAILEYLYVAPAKIAAVQARLKRTP